MPVTLSYFRRVENEESPDVHASIMTHPYAIHQWVLGFLQV